MSLAKICSYILRIWIEESPIDKSSHTGTGFARAAQMFWIYQRPLNAIANYLNLRGRQ
jgi:hypothetical protein